MGTDTPPWTLEFVSDPCQRCRGTGKVNPPSDPTRWTFAQAGWCPDCPEGRNNFRIRLTLGDKNFEVLYSPRHEEPFGPSPDPELVACLARCSPLDLVQLGVDIMAHRKTIHNTRYWKKYPMPEGANGNPEAADATRGA